MVYGNIYHYNREPLTESEINDIESFYEFSNCVEENPINNISLLMSSYQIFAEMQYNMTITNGILNEHILIESNILDWVKEKIDVVIQAVINFFEKAAAKLKMFFAELQRKASLVKNALYIKKIEDQIPKLLKGVTDEQLKKFSYSIKVYRTDACDINLEGAWNYLEKSLEVDNDVLNNKNVEEEILFNTMKELKETKTNVVKEGFIRKLFDSMAYSNSNKPSWNKGTMDLSKGGKTMDFIVPDNVVTFDDKDYRKDAVDNDIKNAVGNNIKEQIDSYFITGQSINYSGLDIKRELSTLLRNACGKDKEKIEDNFKSVDKQIQMVIKGLKKKQAKLKSAMKDTKNDRIASYKYELLVSILNLYQIAQLYSQTLIVSHSVAIVEKANEHFKMIKNFYEFLQDKNF